MEYNNPLLISVELVVSNVQKSFNVSYIHCIYDIHFKFLYEAIMPFLLYHLQFSAELMNV